MGEIILEERTMTSLELRKMVNEARKLAGEKEVRNNDFIARIEDELQGELPVTKISQPAAGGTPQRYYDLTLDQCLQVGMRESKAVRRNVRVKLSQLEGSNQANHPLIPQTYAEALQLAADQAKQLELAAPKVAFVDKYVTADSGSKGFRQVAKLLNANEKEFRAFLSDSKIMYKLGGEWMPYQCHADAGRFEVKGGVADNDHVYNSALFTPKGINWIAGLWAQHCLKGSDTECRSSL